MAATYDNTQRDALKKEILAKLVETGYKSDACRLVGIGRTTLYEWIDQDSAFAAEIDALEAEAKETRRVRLVREVESRALAGSDILLMFATKAHDPDYRDRQQIDLIAKKEEEMPPAQLEALKAELREVVLEIQRRGLLEAPDKEQT